MADEKARKLAEAHWVWLETLLHKVYVDAMLHGIKHGQEEVRERRMTKHIPIEIMLLLIEATSPYNDGWTQQWARKQIEIKVKDSPYRDLVNERLENIEMSSNIGKEA